MAIAQVRRVKLRNYRSIEHCDVELPNLTFLVGPNGSGKTNFLDALRLVADALQSSSLDRALRMRGGYGQVAMGKWAAGSTVRLQFDLILTEGSAEYAIELGTRGRSELDVTETCTVRSPESAPQHDFVAQYDAVVSSEPVLSPPGPGRLYLTSASNQTVFRPVFELLSQMAFYDFNAEVMKAPQVPDSGAQLLSDGGNLASVLERMEKERPELKRIIEEYLGVVTPGVTRVSSRYVDSYQTLAFTQHRGEFPARSVSDGTLRALAVLTAAFQDAPGLVGIEEPETGVHPAAAGVLREALVEASSHRQLLLTSHSPELLNDPDLPLESIVAVQASDGVTRLGPLDRAGRMALRERLYTAGELLRLDQLRPDPGTSSRG
jgi:predicted ATPase